MQNEFNKKSQIYGHIFIYILTIIIVAFILIYGYTAIQNFRDRTEQIVNIKFNNDMNNAVKGLIGDYGSVIKKEIEVGDDIKQVCFVETVENFDKQNPQAINSEGFLITLDPIIKDSISSNADKNVFLVGKTVKKSFYIGKISVDADVMCVTPLNNKIVLRMESLGDHISIDKWR